MSHRRPQAHTAGRLPAAGTRDSWRTRRRRGTGDEAGQGTQQCLVMRTAWSKQRGRCAAPRPGRHGPPPLQRCSGRAQHASRRRILRPKSMLPVHASAAGAAGRMHPKAVARVALPALGACASRPGPTWEQWSICRSYCSQGQPGAGSGAHASYSALHTQRAPGDGGGGGGAPGPWQRPPTFCP